MTPEEKSELEKYRADYPASLKTMNDIKRFKYLISLEKKLKKNEVDKD